MTGPEGKISLLNTSPVAAGAECPAGGTKIQVGLDVDRNGVLDSSEVLTALTRIVCQGERGLQGAAGANGKSALVATTSEPAGTHCATGGTKIEVGQDADGDGILDPAEVDARQTRYACNGNQGSQGVNALVETNLEPVGTNCAAGGAKIKVGLDVNRNGVLDTAEVNTALTRFVCHGLHGLQGAAGANGKNALVATSSELAGSLNCPAGGTKIEVGLDTDGNGSLDPSEINTVQTRYACNGAPGPMGPQGPKGSQGVSGLNALVATISVPAGSPDCATGGTKIEVGMDANGNGVLEPGEIDAAQTRYVCNGVQGPKGDRGDIGPEGPPPYIAVDGGLVGNGQSASPLTVDFSKAPPGPSLWIDTTQFNWIPSNLTNVTQDKTWGVWRYVKHDATTASIVVEPPPQELLDILQPGTSLTPAAAPLKVLHIKLSPGGGFPGRLLQKLNTSVAMGPITMSAYVKVLSGTLFMGQEDAWMGFTNSMWTRISATDGNPAHVLGGTYGFAGSGSFTEALIALPKVELGGVATPYVEGVDTTTVVSTQCTPQSWAQSTDGGAPIIICDRTEIQVPWSALLRVSVQGHLNSFRDGHRCTVGIVIDMDIDPPRDMCCDSSTAALRPVLLHPITGSSDRIAGWIPASAERQKAVAPGTHTVSYFLHSTSSDDCGFNGSSLMVTAYRQ